MNKSETRELARIEAMHAAGLGVDFVARALSAMIRAARTTRSAEALRAAAQRLSCTAHPEFIA